MTDDILIKEKEAEIRKEGENLLRARAGKELEKETPLQEVRRLNDETKNMLISLGDAETRLQKLAADIALGGRSYAGSGDDIKAKLTPQEEARLKGKQFVDKFFKQNV